MSCVLTNIYYLLTIWVVVTACLPFTEGWNSIYSVGPDTLTGITNFPDNIMLGDAPAPALKGFNQECSGSAQCNITGGLCCRLQRRARQRSRNVCSYFKDATECIGSVNPGQIANPNIKLTRGEMGTHAHVPIKRKF